MSTTGDVAAHTLSNVIHRWAGKEQVRVDSGSQDRTYLQALLGRIEDEQLRAELSREVDRRKFGLVFEKHLPEAVALPHVPISRGSKVRLRNTPGGRIHQVARTTGRGKQKVAECVPLQAPKDPPGWTGETVHHPLADLVAVAEYGDAIYPGLSKVGDVAGPGAKDDDPQHVVINGENLHALEALSYTHHESVDLIYIDPPYNTGNKTWIYNDRYVADKDTFRSSKWLSFMERRLQIARRLLKKTGVIFVAIGDDEHHRLRMLMDQTFGRDNFISNIVWQGGRKNDSRFVSNGADYMLVYARDLDSWAVDGVPVKEAPDVLDLNSKQIAERGARWRDPKPGVEEVLAQGAKAWAEADGDEDEATALMRDWFRKQPKDSPVRAHSRSVYFLPDGRLCRDDNITWPGGGGPKYDVLHPVTGQPVPVPNSGWRYGEPGRMQEAIDDGWVIFREDHTKPISLKKPLDTVTGTVALSVFDRQRTHGSRDLYYAEQDSGVFRDKRFPNPKDHEVLMRWIGMAAPKDAVVLDFFAGSGSTAEAVIRLNDEDGGTRQAILVTNNELNAKDADRLAKDGLDPGDPEWEAQGIFHHVTKPRIETVVSGTREDGSTYSEGLPARVAFYDLQYLDADSVAYDEQFEAIAPLLHLAAGGRGQALTERPAEGFSVSEHYGVLHDIDHLPAFLAKLPETATAVFVVTSSDAHFARAAAAMPAGARVHRLYEEYLRTFEINSARKDAHR